MLFGIYLNSLNVKTNAQALSKIPSADLELYLQQNIESSEIQTIIENIPAETIFSVQKAEIKENDIPDIIKRYHNLKAEKNRKRTDNSFMVPFDDIKANDWDLSINRYKEVLYEEVTYAKPDVIIQDIRKLKAESDEKLLILEELLK